MFKDVFGKTPPEVWIAVAVLIIVFILGKVLRRKQLNLPPGPLGLPIVGYFPFLTKLAHLKFIQLSKKYGDIFGFYLGSKFVVVLNDADSIREAFAKKELLARPPNTPLDVVGIKTPFFSSDYHMWHEQRRFVVQSMKDLGLGKSKIEGHMQEEILHFLNVLKESNGKPVNLSKFLTPSMSNNICALVFGERYEYTDPDRVMLDNALKTFATTLSQVSVTSFFPCIQKVPFLLKMAGYEKVLETFRSIDNFIKKKISSHKETIDSRNVRDFIDSYLLETKSRTESGQETSFSEETLKGCVLNLFGAGSETVRTSISWCMYIMAAYPEVQAKVRREIQEVMGESRCPEFLDQKNMPYTQAVIKEIMRWKNVVPLNVARYTLDNVEVAGYHIPKETIVLANLWAVHHDPRYWKDPENFLPERFLDEQGNLVKSPNFMPFSVGKRSCPGETMAMMEIFLYFVFILQKFQVSFPSGFQPTFEAELGITFGLKPHSICFLPQ